jgi:hypothetical protein
MRLYSVTPSTASELMLLLHALFGACMHALGGRALSATLVLHLDSPFSRRAETITWRALMMLPAAAAAGANISDLITSNYTIMRAARRHNVCISVFVWAPGERCMQLSLHLIFSLCAHCVGQSRGWCVFELRGESQDAHYWDWISKQIHGSGVAIFVKHTLFSYLQRYNQLQMRILFLYSSFRNYPN